MPADAYITAKRQSLYGSSIFSIGVNHSVRNITAKIDGPIQNAVTAPLSPRRGRGRTLLPLALRPPGRIWVGAVWQQHDEAAIRQERVTASAHSKSFPDVTRFR